MNGKGSTFTMRAVERRGERMTTPLVEGVGSYSSYLRILKLRLRRQHTARQEGRQGAWIKGSQTTTLDNAKGNEK
jgi:hypothetical protein